MSLPDAAVAQRPPLPSNRSFGVLFGRGVRPCSGDERNAWNVFIHETVRARS